jgi:lipoprotein-anchoring transpeptidase ErfK/SrfK
MPRVIAAAVTAAVLTVPAAAEAATVKVYALRGEQLASLERSVPRKRDVAAAIRALLAGPSASERAAGYGSAIPDEVKLTEARVNRSRKIVHLRFGRGLTDRKNAAVDGARLAQIVYTAAEVAGYERVSVRTPERKRTTYSRDSFAPPPYQEPEPKPDRLPQPDDVRLVQVHLAARGYLPADAVTGTWDYRTRQAVLAFQSWEGLERDGIVDAETAARLEVAGRPAAMERGPGRRVEIYRDRGVVLLVNNGRVERAIHASTGIGGDSVNLGTPPGSYRIYRKERRSWSLPYRTWLPYAAYWSGGWALHGSVDVPALPASHGGARIPLPEAKTVYDFVRVGTRVRVI